MARTMVWGVVAAIAALPVMAAIGTGGTAAAASAEAYEVRITGLPERFQAGGQGGIMSVSVTRLVPECARIRALMLITLQGIDYGHLKVEVKTGSGWEISPISRAGDNTLRAEDNWIDVNFLCQGQVRALQHRITFLPGAPAGSALIDVVISSMGDSAEAGRGKATRPVVAGAAAPAPSPTRGRSSPTPTHAPATAPSAEAVAEADTAEFAAGRATRATVVGPTRPVSAVVITTGGGAVVVLLSAGLFAFWRWRRRA